MRTRQANVDVLEASVSAPTVAVTNNERPPMAGQTSRPARRRRFWVYGDHPTLNPGWRLGDSNLVLDYDRLSSACTPDGAWILWQGGNPGQPVDHFLDGAMQYIEQTPASDLAIECGSSDPRTPAEQLLFATAYIFEGTAFEYLTLLADAQLSSEATEVAAALAGNFAVVE